MNNHDYTKELSLDSGVKLVPWPQALLILAIFAAAAWFGIRALMAHTTLNHSTSETSQSH